MEALIRALEDAKISLERDCLLARHASFRVGGKADLALFPQNIRELVDCMRLLSACGVKYVVIGNASNVVFSDQGFRGAVVFTKHCRDFSVEGSCIRASAGASLSGLSLAAREESLCGLAFAYGIPGTLGGALFMNAGAFGGCIADVCVSSRYYDVKTGQTGTVVGEAHAFDVRSSIYQVHPEWVILEATLNLLPGSRSAIDADMHAFSEQRRRTQPLELPNAGSVFKRPAGHFAGKLIEDCGLKGYRIGGAEISQKHAGFIVNQGEATAEDIRRLTEHIKTVVFERTGVNLTCEIRFL